MNAQEKLIEYGKEIKAKSNIDNVVKMTAEEIIGKAFVEGICVRRDGSTRTAVYVVRNGKTITVTETIISEDLSIVDGRIVTTEIRSSTDVIKIDL